MLFLFYIAAASGTHRPVDESPPIPLEAPPPPKKLHPQSVLPAPAPAVVPAKQRHWLVGVAAGGAFAPSGPLRLAGNVRLMFGYVRPDAVDHLGVSLEPEILFAANAEAAAQRSSAFLFSLPLLASVNFSVGPGLLRVLAGPSFDDYAFHFTGPRTFVDSGASIGFTSGVAYLFYLPVGALGLDARFHYAPDTVLGVRADTYLITAGASYVVIL